MSCVVLKGCHPRPVASYLKALAVFRLVSEQADARAQARWSDDRLVIDSFLDQDHLVEFLVKRYSPTPLVAPWNGGSGFYEGDSTAGLDAILASSDSRFDDYRVTITEIQAWPEMPEKFDSIDKILGKLAAAEKNTKGKSREKLANQVKAVRGDLELTAQAIETEDISSLPLEEIERRVKKNKEPKKSPINLWLKEVKKARTACKQIARSEVKGDLYAVCRSRLRDESLAWFDAAIALMANGEAAMNPIVGTGGNEGRLDFSNNFMQRVAELLLLGNDEQCSSLLTTALFEDPRPEMISASIGQFDPGRAGGYNQGFGVETKNFKINPWDFVLAMEGALVLSSSVGKKSAPGGRQHAALPFTVDFSGVGFASSETDEAGRAETWLPLWSKPTRYDELRYLFSEGRSQVGRRSSRNGLDFTRAVSTLGVDRGIDEFERYAFLERRGDSYVALPAGRLPVRFQPSVRMLDDLDPILSHVDRFIRGFPNVPATFQSARRRIDEAIFQCSIEPRAERFADLVCALGRMERLIAQRDRHKKPQVTSPLSGLRPQWISVCDDGGPEVRIAAALASIRSTGKVGPIRANLAGVDPAAPWRWAVGHGQTRWHGNSLADRMGSALEQRMMDAERLSAPNVPIEGSVQLSPYDVVSFLLGETDDVRLEELLWGFTLVAWHKGGHEELRYRWKEPLDSEPMPRGFAAMKLALSPRKVRGKRLVWEPRIPSLLRAGRASETVALAHKRLRVSNLKPLPVEADDWIDARRQLAALLIPTRDQWLLESLVLEEKEQPEEG
ncbi:MAG: type I-U CRISPR-associated protein Csx17 [Polyangia bacterium]